MADFLSFLKTNLVKIDGELYCSSNTCTRFITSCRENWHGVNKIFLNH